MEGCVCIYIINSIAFNTRTDLQTDGHGVESLWIELLLPKTKPIVIGTIYRPPKMSDFIDKFENVLCQLKSDTETIILGVFNIFIKKKNHLVYHLLI